MDRKQVQAVRALIRRESYKYSTDIRILLLVPSAIVVFIAQGYLSDQSRAQSAISDGFSIEPVFFLKWAQYSLTFTALLTGLLLGATSIAKERETGSILITAAPPLSRQNLLFAKLIGRWIVISALIVSSLVVTGVPIVLAIGMPDPLAVVGLILVTGVYVVIGLAIGAIGSTITNQTHLAGGIAIGLIGLVELLCQQVARRLPGVDPVGAFMSSIVGSEHAFEVLLNRLSPVSSYVIATNWIMGGPNSASFYGDATRAVENPNIPAPMMQIDPKTPILFEEWISLFLLVTYALIGIFVAKAVLERGDL